MKRRTFILLFLQFLLITNNLADGKTKLKGKPNHKQLPKKNEGNSKAERVKRSIDDEDDKPFWANRGKKQSEENKVDYGFVSNILFRPQERKVMEEDEHPFWANRGRRFDSSSSEYRINEFEPDIDHQGSKICQYSCVSPFNILKSNDGINSGYLKERREESSPFWGNRGRRNSGESNEVDNKALFLWDNRGGKQPDDALWANRGRREEDSPFWGNRGRRQDDSPFWGARGRREESSPFWGARGRRQEDAPFWGNRGRRQEDPPFWGQRGRRKIEDLKESINDAIEADIDTLARLRRSSIEPFFTIGTKTSFWGNRGRDSKLQYLFNNKQKSNYNNYLKKNRGSSTLHDNKLFVEQPHYIIVDRSSRSASMEDDPYYISRGKKKIIVDGKAARDRRGIIEEIVKSVKNDPYYIARGKKDKGTDDNPVNVTGDSSKLLKTKDLICSAIELMNSRNDTNKVKREASDNERDRRTILKKLAAQLQNDPYMVSRGKKSSDFILENDYEDFITRISEMCN